MSGATQNGNQCLRVPDSAPETLLHPKSFSLSLKKSLEVSCESARGQDPGLEKPKRVDVCFLWLFVYPGLRHRPCFRIWAIRGDSIYLTPSFSWKCPRFLTQKKGGLIVEFWCPSEGLIPPDNSLPPCHHPFDSPVVTGSQGHAKCILLLSGTKNVAGERKGKEGGEEC